jgi:DNA-binding NarL/FixJ family response regulator
MLAVISNILSRIERTSAELARLVNTAHGEETNASSSQPAHGEDFTEGETRVARLVATGISNKEIAAELGLSVRTVEGHISNILAKKGWTGRVEIARHMYERGEAGPRDAQSG